MTTRAPMDPRVFVDFVGEALSMRRTPVDPVSLDEYRAVTKAFPAESWRWTPGERERVEMLGELPDPADEAVRAKAISTLLEHADEFGPVLQMLAASPGGADVV